MPLEGQPAWLEPKIDQARRFSSEHIAGDAAWAMNEASGHTMLPEEKQRLSVAIFDLLNVADRVGELSEQARDSLAVLGLALVNKSLAPEGRNTRTAFVVVEADPWPPRGDD